MIIRAITHIQDHRRRRLSPLRRVGGDGLLSMYVGSRGVRQDRHDDARETVKYLLRATTTYHDQRLEW